jgi:hypothetical protein
MDTLTQALVGDEEQRRAAGLRALQTAHPSVLYELVDRLLTELERSNDQIALRAQIALGIIGRRAVPALSMAVRKSRSRSFRLRLIPALMMVGMGLRDIERIEVISLLIGIRLEDQEKEVRDAAESALQRIRAADAP